MNYFVAAMDLGGSEFRGIFNNGEVVKSPSDFKEIELDAAVVKDTPDPLDDFIIKKCSVQNLEGRRFIKRGAFAAHTGGTQRADNQAKKHLQDATYINGFHALAKNMYIGKATPEGKHNAVKTAMGIAIPASEFYTEGAPEVVKNSFSGLTEIHFPVINKTVKFYASKKDVIIAPEGIIGLFKMITGEYKNVLKSGQGIIVDPGRLTTEIVLVHKFVANSGTAMSYPQAGSILESLVSNKLIRADLPNTHPDIMSAISTGKVKKYGQDVPVGMMIQEAKRSLSKITVDNIIEVINSQGTRLTNYEYIVPMGRCFNVVGEEGDSHYTGDLLKNILADLDANLGVINPESTDEANVTGVNDVLQKKYGKAA